MKKIKLLLSLMLLIGSTYFLKAQCMVLQDGAPTSADSAGCVNCLTNNFSGDTTWTITTSYSGELIMIAYDGWLGPGIGPVTVDGNNATFIVKEVTGNTACADIWAYACPNAGTHNIVGSPGGYNTGYYLFHAAAFRGTCGPLSLSDISATTYVADTTCAEGGTLSLPVITTNKQGSCVYATAAFNQGDFEQYPLYWTGATGLSRMHVGDGIETGQAYAGPSTKPTGTNQFFNISAKTYHDSSVGIIGCGGLTIAAIVITPNTKLPLTDSITEVANVSCYGDNNGSAIVTAVTGPSPYTYLWEPSGQTTYMAVGLSPGTDTVFVTNALGNTDTLTVTITQPSAPLADGTPVLNSNVSCYGSDNGSATAATPTGGTSPYFYQWNSGTKSTNTTANNLSAGTYTVTVTDANGCMFNSSGTVIITQPTELTITAGVITNETTCNGNTGSALASASGGISPYSYYWSDVNNQTTALATGLTAGTYTVIAQDNCSDTATAVIVILQPETFVANITTTNVSCNSTNNGSAIVAVTGGVSPYTYVWNDANSQTTDFATGLSVGVYIVMITDSNGCSDTVSCTILSAEEITAYIASVTNNTSCITPNGSITVADTGGVAPYTYLWTPSGQTTATATGLSAGYYTCLVTDSNGCSTQWEDSTVSAYVSNNTLNVYIASTSNNGNCNGTAIAIITGGTGPFTYLWSPGGQTDSAINGLCNDSTYCCTVRDNAGCIDSVCTTIVGDTIAGIKSVSVLSSLINVYPNPAINYVQISYKKAMAGTIILSNTVGQVIYKQIIPASTTIQNLDLSTLSDGVYILSIQTTEGRLVKKIMKL